MRLRRGDVVECVSGENEGKRGKILSVRPDGRVVVEGVNIVWKHVRKSQKHPKGGRIEREAPIPSAALRIVCQSCSKPTRVRWGWLEDPQVQKKSRKKVRLCVKCGKAVRVKE